jgi:hypothetical protein
VDNWKNITNSQNSVRKKSFGGTFCFSNCHIIRLDTGGLGFLSLPLALNFLPKKGILTIMGKMGKWGKNGGPKWKSKIGGQNGGPKWESEIGVPKWGPKSGYKMGEQNGGTKFK